MAMAEAVLPGDNSDTVPSLFELLAQDQLRDLLHPVFRYVLTQYPRYWLRVINRHEEAFAILMLVLERHHLKKHNASLSDHFYQLRLAPLALRTPRLISLEAPRPRPLSRRQRWGMLLVLVGLPYARARAQDAYERLGGREGQAEPSLVARWGKLYPYANMTLDLTLLAYDIGYLFERMPYRPWYKWLGIRVERHVDDGFLANLPPLLPPLLLALKLAQWWYSASSPRSLPTTDVQSSHRLIPPPKPLPLLRPVDSPSPPLETGAAAASELGMAASPSRSAAEFGLVATAAESAPLAIGPDEYGLCPICQRAWANPAILPSGWVVCWRCGWDALTGEDDDDKATGGTRAAGESADATSRIRIRRGHCPITGVPVRIDELRRVLV